MQFKHRKATMSKQNNQSGGLGFVSVLTLIFITLKLTDTITWSWLWVLSPIWISVLLAITLTTVLLFSKSKF